MVTFPPILTSWHTLSCREPSSHSDLRRDSQRKLIKTDLFLTGSDTEPEIKSGNRSLSFRWRLKPPIDTTPREDIGEEQNSDSLDTKSPDILGII